MDSEPWRTASAGELRQFLGRYPGDTPLYFEVVGSPLAQPVRPLGTVGTYLAGIASMSDDEEKDESFDRIKYTISGFLASVPPRLRGAPTEGAVYAN
jgi:hypothetical protein